MKTFIRGRNKEEENVYGTVSDKWRGGRLLQYYTVYTVFYTAASLGAVRNSIGPRVPAMNAAFNW